MHGHTYRVELLCTGPVREDGMLVDYADLAEAWRPIHLQLDHRVLNDVRGLENPTTEVLVHWLLQQFEGCGLPIAVIRVYESSTTWCEATRG